MSLAVDEENTEGQTPEKPCSGLRKELKECILESDCVKKVGLCFKNFQIGTSTVYALANRPISLVH